MDLVLVFQSFNVPILLCLLYIAWKQKNFQFQFKLLHRRVGRIEKKVGIKNGKDFEILENEIDFIDRVR